MVNETPILPWDGVIAELEAKLEAAEAVVEAARDVLNDPDKEASIGGLYDALAAYDALQGKQMTNETPALPKPPKTDIDAEVKDMITKRRLTCEDMPF